MVTKEVQMKRVLTVGVFDMLHIGHINLVRNARKYGDYLVVAVQDSKYVLDYKPDTTLVYSTEDRMFMVGAIRYVDEVIVYKSVDEIVRNTEFDVFATGPDQIHSGFQDAIQWCRDHGKETVVIPRTEGISSTRLKGDLI